MTLSRTRIAGWYFVAQGAAIVAWWLCLWLFPPTRALFVPAGASEIELLAFAVPDLLVAAPASVVAGLACLLGSRLAIPAAWTSTGAMAYAFSYCVAWSLLRHDAWINVVLMAPPALLSGVCALDVSAPTSIFRRASLASATRHIVMTGAQIAVFWALFLLVLPFALLHIERQLAWPGISFVPAETFGGFLFFLFSGLGLWSGFTMARDGAGTPLPIDAPNRLVVSGPYAHVRNPMAIAGLGQGVSVGLSLGSGLVLAYVLLGTAIWQFLVRPSEEHNLHEVFGAEFGRYRESVRCWRPRLTPYRQATLKS